MKEKKMSAGVWVAVCTAILAVISLIVYSMNVSSAGYFQNASVNNLVLYGILAVAALVVAIVLSRVKVSGAAGKVVSLVTGCLQIAAPALLALCLINLVSGRVEGLGFIYFSNADVALEVQTAETMSSATTAITSMVCFGVSMLAGIVAAFFNLNKAEAK